jgi:predicted ATPase
MNREKQRVQAILDAALERPFDERTEYVTRVCGGDGALRDAVLALLEDEARPARDGRGRAALAPGTLLEGKYRIDALLGRGGMGEVYRATQLRLDRAVAIKLIRGGHASDSALERFRREALAVARLKHPNIVGIFDLSSAEGVGTYLVMELVGGRSLREELRVRGRLPAAEALALMAQICAAVDAAHRAGIVHRDLKPDNVMLEPAGRGVSAKILDFGVAKLHGSAALTDRALTTSGALIGTPVYMSPEQCQGEPADERADVYALGAMLYEMVAGEPPFSARTVADLVHKHVYEPPVPPSRHNPAVDDGLERAILRALAKRPAERFPTAAALGEALGGPAAAPAAVLPITDRVPPLDPDATCVVGTAAEAPARETVWDGASAPLTSLVGRDPEIVAIERQLATSRLVTLTGPGGTGKTRLARAVADKARTRFRDGAFFVDLSPVADASLVASAIARELGVMEARGRPLADAIAEFLHGREALLVLDNFEQVVDAAPFVTRLLGAAPRLSALVTSRTLLRVGAEREFPVPALDLPPAGRLSPEEAARYGAVALFVERAGDARRGFALTADNVEAVCEICRRLDGLPLAIELAAARLRLLAPHALLARLGDRLKLLVGGPRDLPERQQTMRSAVAWSYDLLGEDEKLVFERLSVFAGGCTLEAAEDVCAGGNGPEADVFDAVSSLVEKSLLQQREQADGETRFRMLEVVREYALERLVERGQADETRRRHALACLALAERDSPQFFDTRAANWLGRVEEEHDNLRAALSWLLEHDAEGALRLAAAIRNFWLARGHLTEGRRWLAAALERAGADAPSRSRALDGAGKLAWRQGDLGAARASFEEWLRLADARGDLWSIGWSTYSLGLVSQDLLGLDAARAYLERSLEVGRQLGSDSMIAHPLVALGEIARREEQWARARDLYEQALEIHRRAGDPEGTSTALINLGAVAYETGDLDLAGARYQEALAIDRQLGSACAVSYSLDGLAAVAARRGRWHDAARLAAAAEGLRDAAGYELEPVDRDFRERYLAVVRENLDGADAEEAFDSGRTLSLDEAASLGLDSASG